MSQEKTQVKHLTEHTASSIRSHNSVTDNYQQEVGKSVKHYIKEDIQMPRKYMERCSLSLGKCKLNHMSCNYTSTSSVQK